MQDDGEIVPERKDVMSTSDHVRDYMNAMKRIKTPPRPALEHRPSCAVKKHQDLAVRILEVAARIYSPGDEVSPSVIARDLEIPRTSVSPYIVRLKARGEWPYMGVGTGKWQRKKT